MEQITRPFWTTVVMPDEYDIVGQFDEMVKKANKRSEHFPPVDVGKIVGLLDAWQAQKTALAAAETLVKAAGILRENYYEVDDEFTDSFDVDKNYELINSDNEESCARLTFKQIVERRYEKALADYCAAKGNGS